MSTTVFLAVLGAAIMHASWNALIKVRLDRFASISLASLGMGLFALPLLFVVEVPQGVTWLWISISVVIHAGYRLFLVKAYEAGDLGQTYPLARGTAPLLTVAGGIILLREVPPASVITGILILSAGTLLMSMRGGTLTAKPGGHAVFYALITAVFIAGYTLSDGTGARSAATATSYAAWLFVIDATCVMVLWIAARGQKVLHVIRAEWKTGILTGFLSAFSYWIAMWAMTKAPIAAVAALRETSILFAMLISVVALGEKMTRWRVMAALCIVTGVIALRLG